MNKKIQYEKSSGNVFEDLGFPNPELEILKAQLAFEVFRIIKQRRLTQFKAANLLGVGQPEISKLKHGKYSRFKVERLFYFLNRLNRNVDIKISPSKGSHPHQRVIGEN